jgi:hypothetical protein
MHTMPLEWEAFCRENPTTCDAITLGCDPSMNGFLLNRLHRAFSCGFNAGKQLQREEIEARVARFLLECQYESR